MMVNVCCNNIPKYFIEYSIGKKDEPWLVCESHWQETLFQKYITSKRELTPKELEGLKKEDSSKSTKI
jgi:hypothetical protein